MPLWLSAACSPLGLSTRPPSPASASLGSEGAHSAPAQTLTPSRPPKVFTFWPAGLQESGKGPPSLHRSKGVPHSPAVEGESSTRPTFTTWEERRARELGPLTKAAYALI